MFFFSRFFFFGLLDGFPHLMMFMIALFSLLACIVFGDGFHRLLVLLSFYATLLLLFIFLRFVLHGFSFFAMNCIIYALYCFPHSHIRSHALSFPPLLFLFFPYLWKALLMLVVFLKIFSPFFTPCFGLDLGHRSWKLIIRCRRYHNFRYRANRSWFISYFLLMHLLCCYYLPSPRREAHAKAASTCLYEKVQ